MNLAHNLICASGWWGRRVERELLPWGLEDSELGDDVLEIGPGFGKTTRLLAARLPRLTVVELEPRYCRRLAAELGATVAVVQGDATELPFADSRFSGVVCFTMLHHVPRSRCRTAYSRRWLESCGLEARSPAPTASASARCSS